ncbi:rod shape-determining protein RodA [Portibacter lacus]|uniref:Cell wall polymerase n=1 Tax=Portibacter lacus TaxID=1099794 RepID=A0AA37SXS9_9BACT|nr:rod shape-determining protein RodA [Portibacter lacus]GLR19775.1 rod shape-determining protein RodA [Portibacter lacus]
MARINTAIRSGIDWVALSTYLALVLIGWLMIYSSNADSSVEESAFSFADLFSGHFIWVIISFFVFICTLFIDWKFWDTFSYVFYALGILSLIGVLIFGLEINDARSWYSFFGLSFQPGETAKFFTCLALSSYLSSYKTDLSTLKSQAIAISIFILPSFLIILQPDAGSAIVFFSFFILLFREGISPLYFVIGLSLLGIFVFSLIFGPITVIFLLIALGIGVLISNFKNRTPWVLGLLAAVILSLVFVPKTDFIYTVLASIALFFVVLFLQWDARKLSYYIIIGSVILISGLFSYGSNYAFEKVLAPHQQDRINVWLRPDLASYDVKYNIIQSKLAIGSGGLQGKGFLQGDMTKLNYVPEKSSDFIFSIIGEEQGFLGVISVVLLFLLLLYRIIVIAERSKSNFVRHYGYGVAGILFVHYFINIGMTMGIMPVIGIPLPFLSQGGTSLLAFSLMIGVLLKMDLSR